MLYGPGIIILKNVKDMRVYVARSSNIQRALSQLLDRIHRGDRKLPRLLIQDKHRLIPTLIPIGVNDPVLLSIEQRKTMDELIQQGYSLYNSTPPPKYFLRIVPIAYKTLYGEEKGIRWHVEMGKYRGPSEHVIGVFMSKEEAIDWCKDMYGPYCLNKHPIDRVVWACNAPTRLYYTNPIVTNKYLREEYQKLIKNIV